jgi:tRNA(Ile)-lysidine synthase
MILHIIINLMLLETIRKKLIQFGAVESQRPFVVGVSGGPDSMALVDAMIELGCQVIVAHYNHQLRSDSGQDAVRVNLYANDHRVKFCLGEANVAEYANTEMLSIEEAARILRYRFLFDCARQANAQAVAVGHTADDQVETILMHLIRGTGTEGLKGMGFSTCPNLWSDSIPLVRPLLSVWREDILKYLNAENITPCEDSSNTDITFLRNRIRHELIPVLQTYNSQIKSSIIRISEIARTEIDILDQATEECWKKVIKFVDSDRICIDSQLFGNLHLGLKRRVIRKAIVALRPGINNLEFASVNRGLDFLSSGKISKRFNLIAGLFLFCESGQFWLCTWEADLPHGCWPKIETAGDIILNLPGATHISNEWEISAEYVPINNDTREIIFENPDPYQAWLSARDFKSPLQIRARNLGDRLIPFGLNGNSVEISDFMINYKIPRKARNTWPLVICNEMIAWIPGYRIAHPFRITGNDEKAIHLSLINRAR